MGEANRATVAQPPGLVSVPTSQNSPRAADAAALRDELSAFVPRVHEGRLARMRRSVGFAARAHLCSRRGFRPDKVVMVTLTYRDGDDWRPKHVSVLLDHIRHWCKAKGIQCRYVWVAELQTRGAIHYHLALWIPLLETLPKADDAGWWPHGYTRTEQARAAVPYLMKYLSKGSGAQRLPDGARMHGVGGLDHSMRRAARWLRLPGFVQARSDIFDEWRPQPGGGWSGPDGALWPSEFKRAWLGDGYGLMRVHRHGRPFHPDGPFTWLHRRPQR